jgi:hypothetical protein
MLYLLMSPGKNTRRTDKSEPGIQAAKMPHLIVVLFVQGGDYGNQKRRAAATAGACEAQPSPAQPSPQHGWVSPPARHLTRSTDRNVLPQLTKNAPPQRVRG